MALPSVLATPLISHVLKSSITNVSSDHWPEVAIDHLKSNGNESNGAYSAKISYDRTNQTPMNLPSTHTTTITNSISTNPACSMVEKRNRATNRVNGGEFRGMAREASEVA